MTFTRRERQLLMWIYFQGGRTTLASIRKEGGFALSILENLHLKRMVKRDKRPAQGGSIFVGQMEILVRKEPKKTMVYLTKAGKKMADEIAISDDAF